MQKVTLTRTNTGDQGTFGILETEGFRCVTGELPWRDNKPNVSSIPEGEYTCIHTYSPAFKKHLYLVSKVPGRSGVRIHGANFMGDRALGYKSQLNGCIALAKRFVIIHGQKSILNSQVGAFEDFMLRKPFILEIKNV